MNPPQASSIDRHPLLRRDVGLVSACLMGLGSIVGTGVFVSLGLAAETAGHWLPWALVIAAVVAACNGLSSAALASVYPVSGGTYEYGYRLLNPFLGFQAGWMFLCAKTASAATAALGCGGYLVQLLHAESVMSHRWLAVLVVCVIAAGIQSGIRQSGRLNAALVAVSVASLLALIIVATAAPHPVSMSPAAALSESWRGIAQATALMFVAYTGYGRIATLGEEVQNPRRTIPLAVVITLVISAVLYVGVASASLRVLSPAQLGWLARTNGAPLQLAAQAADAPRVATFLGLGAAAAMMSVLLNLMLGLSRVFLAMARRGDAPRILSKLDRSHRSPKWAVIASAAIIAGLAATGSIKATWSFSAFSVLIYYAITNFAALQLPPAQRLVPAFVPLLGLISCLFLALWIEPSIWAWGAGVLMLGSAWFRAARRFHNRSVIPESFK